MIRSSGKAKIILVEKEKIIEGSLYRSERIHTLIREFNSSDRPVLTVSISSDVLPQRVLVNLTQDLLDVIETHPNVLTAELNGVPEDLIEAVVEKNKLESYGISMNQLYQAVANNNRVTPAGSQDTGKGRFAVNVPSVFASLDDIERLPIKVSGSSVVTLRDVANVSLTYKDRGGYSRTEHVYGDRKNKANPN